MGLLPETAREARYSRRRGGSPLVHRRGPARRAPQTPSLKWVNYQSSTVGADILVRLRAPDPQRQRVVFTATGLPPGLTVDPATGVVTGRPGQPGSFESRSPRPTATATPRRVR
ncbi:putative Ig domain-containing protein [Streptomyces sp. NPDC060010]|uniref:putative Ig domain-containing protein n=1 Tax=Streptomyces sp. NPDC060010 TaxID=3347036 RepID=UPI0036BC1A5E